MKTNVVTWFEIYVDDMPRAQKFYETVLGNPMEEMPSPMPSDEFQMVSFPWVQDAPNASGALVKAKDVKAGGGGTMVYFTCEDCSVEESRVLGAGGQILAPKFSIGDYGFCTVCMDTEGNNFGLHSMK